MPDVVIYLLKANLAVILFYVVYRWLLRKLTFYTLNRFYLLFALFFSMGYPLVDVGALLEKADQTLPGEVVYIIPDWQQVPADTFDWWPLITALIGGGVAWFAMKLLMRLGSLWRIHRGSRPAMWRLFRYRQVFGNVLPFSFWQHIYVNVHNHSECELEEIFEHEQIHVDGLHTLDVLLAELCGVICWFNPGAWLIRHAIYENLEFITDRRVLQSGVDKKAYQYSLLKVGTYAAGNPAIGNGFNFKSLKRRIAMMNKRRSSRLQLGKYMVAIPAVAVFVLVFTVTKAYQHRTEMDGLHPAGIIPAVATAVDTPSVATVSDDDAPMMLDGGSDPIGETVPKGTVRDNRAAERLNFADMFPNVPLAKQAAWRTDSLSSSPPLFVVDGEIYPERDLNGLNPNHIERIDVLKGGEAATALYGRRGDNGIVYITTKRDASEGGGRRTLDGLEEVAVVGSPMRTTDTLQESSIRIRGYGMQTLGDNAVTDNNADNAAGRVAIRGVATGNADFNGALVIIDGEEKEDMTLKLLPPDDIEAIRVWKDKAAVDKYGDKGRNGVIEITTKRRQ
ncbi:TonB-dependent receptor plug domain-containing protein [Parapedobacter sp. ISTM3]|uniref:M56 family metallopeptidase n=1 Tax=Parapedobacter sp. ISTM3 TaxID=2800130 RepID=UPI0019067E42|nr:TonB-dependent receptor plug domain-containing protein [Parapedobacter sp. ISTM3]